MPKLCSCIVCGYEWESGKDGAHYCAEVMRRELIKIHEASKNVLDRSSRSCQNLAITYIYDIADQIVGGEADQIVGDE